MPYILKQQSTRPGGRITFDFGRPVVNYIIGLNAFKLAFPKSGGDHWIRAVHLGLDFPDPPRGGTDTVTVAVSADMHDASGNHLSREESSVTVACVAFTGGQNAPVMGNRRNLNDASELSIGHEGERQRIGVMSGFSFGDKTDHQIQDLTIRAPEPNVSKTTVQMYSRRGRVRDYESSLDVGYAAIDRDHTENLKWHHTGGWLGRVDFDLPVWVPVKEVVTMLNGFDIGFPDPHNVLSIEAFAGNGTPYPPNPPEPDRRRPYPPDAWYSQADITLAAAYIRDGRGTLLDKWAISTWVFATIGPQM